MREIIRLLAAAGAMGGDVLAVRDVDLPARRPVATPRPQFNGHGCRPNGPRETARRRRQIAAGRLNASSGLWLP